MSKRCIKRETREDEYIVDDSKEFVPLDLTEEECDKIIEEELKKMRFREF